LPGGDPPHTRSKAVNTRPRVGEKIPTKNSGHFPAPTNWRTFVGEVSGTSRAGRHCRTGRRFLLITAGLAIPCLSTTDSCGGSAGPPPKRRRRGRCFAPGLGNTPPIPAFPFGSPLYPKWATACAASTLSLISRRWGRACTGNRARQPASHHGFSFFQRDEPSLTPLSIVGGRASGGTSRSLTRFLFWCGLHAGEARGCPRGRRSSAPRDPAGGRCPHATP
jgi:hypothetical protein